MSELKQLCQVMNEVDFDFVDLTKEEGNDNSINPFFVFKIITFDGIEFDEYNSLN